MGSNFGVFGSLEGAWALPGAPWGPLGGQGAPNMGPGSEKLVRWTPPGFPNEVILASIFIDFLDKKGIDFRLDYGNDFKRKMMPKWLQKPLKIH